MSKAGVWQLRRLVIEYCGFGGSSKGTRQFIRDKLPAFAEANPQVDIEVVRRQNRHPVARGTYVCGNEKVTGLRKYTPKEVLDVCQVLRDQSGRKMTKVRKFEIKPVPSFQGEWRHGVAQKATLKITDL